MAFRKVIIFALVALCVIVTCGGCGRTRVVATDTQPFLPIDGRVTLDELADLQNQAIDSSTSEESPADQEDARQEPAGNATQTTTGTPQARNDDSDSTSDGQWQDVTSTPNTTASQLLNVAPSPSYEQPQASSSTVEQPHASPSTSQDSQKSSDTPTRSNNGKKKKGNNDSSSKKGSKVNEDTQHNEDAPGKKNSDEQEEDSQLIESKLAHYKNELTKAGSLYCAAKKAYAELVTDYDPANRTTAMGRAVTVPQVTNVCYDKHGLVDDAWVGDRRDNISIIVKAVPSDVLGSGVNDTAKAEATVDAIVSREGWGTVNAVKNGAIVLVSSDFLETDVGCRMLSVYLGVMAYPSMYNTEELKYGNMEELYKDITGKDLDGLYFYPASPIAMEEEPYD